MYETTHFPKAKFYWHEGKFYDWSDAHLHPMSHALHYGSSVFEGIRAYETPKGTARPRCGSPDAAHPSDLFQVARHQVSMQEGEQHIARAVEDRPYFQEDQEQRYRAETERCGTGRQSDPHQW